MRIKAELNGVWREVTIGELQSLAEAERALLRQSYEDARVDAETLKEELPQ